jgi:hypothetical protein
MKTTLFTRAPRTGEDHLGDDLGAAELPLQPIPARHAENTAHRTANLGGNAQPIAGQQDALHGLAIGQFHQQTRGTVRAGVFAPRTGQPVQVGHDAGQRAANVQREKILGLAVAGIHGHALDPGPQQARLVAGLGAVVAQALTNVFNTHGMSRTATAPESPA